MMRILILFDQSTKNGLANRLAMSHLLTDCLPDIEQCFIALSREHGPLFVEENNGITVWGTDSSVSTVVVWDFALARLGDDIYSFDYIIFSTSDFFPSPSTFKHMLTQQLLQNHLGQPVVLGVEAHSQKPLSLAGHLFNTWLCSSFLVLPPELIRKLGTLSGVQDVDALFTKQATTPHFANLAVNGAYRAYINQYFEQSVPLWEEKYLVDDDVFLFLHTKFVNLVQEHALSLRIKNLCYKAVSINATSKNETVDTSACAPIAYICFNRPQTVAITLKALSEATHASHSDLHIFIDAPRNEADVCGIESVLSICNDEAITQRFASVTIHRQAYNIGACAANKQAIRTMCAFSENFIMLEDDVLFSPHALNYFNLALKKYKDMPSVFGISSARPPAMKIPDAYPWDAFFYPRTGIWGWASWADRMQRVDWTAADICEFEQSSMLIDAFNRGGHDMAPMLSSTVRAPQLGWDIVMDFSRFKHGGVCLTPCYSYSINIGVDMSGAGSIACNLAGQDNCRAVEHPILPDFVVVDPQMEQATRDGITTLWWGDPEGVWKAG